MKPTGEEALVQAADEVLDPSQEEWVEIWNEQKNILSR